MDASEGFGLERGQTFSKEIKDMIKQGMNQSSINFKMLKNTNN